MKNFIYVLIVIASLVKFYYFSLPPFAIEIANHKLIEVNLSVFICICLIFAVKKWWPADKEIIVAD